MAAVAERGVELVGIGHVTTTQGHQRTTGGHQKLAGLRTAGAARTRPSARTAEPAAGPGDTGHAKETGGAQRAERTKAPAHGKASKRDEAGGAAEQPGAERAWPVEGPAGIRPTVVRGWEPPPSPWAAGHRGVDLASRAGATVRSAAPGKVAYAGAVAGRGVLTIEVSRSGRPPLRTTYEPVRPTVRKGQRVTAGQPVAVLQRGPFHCRAPCLHWGLRRGKTYLDPLSLLPKGMRSSRPSRLLPVFGVPLPPGGSAVPRGPEAPEPTAQEGRQNPPVAGLMGAVALAVAALWALGRLAPRRSPGGKAVRGAEPRAGPRAGLIQAMPPVVSNRACR
ncbi:murein hydrolase activator EnvC family protein [Streptomyces sp. NPDC059008]|uniref:murein hydrolase activator EnvC family protein n=1 Tax=Streptomyces sp. NPDC059008 TaxID=3346693 RepID=UPI0036AB012B